MISIGGQNWNRLSMPSPTFFGQSQQLGLDMAPQGTCGIPFGSWNSAVQGGGNRQGVPPVLRHGFTTFARFADGCTHAPRQVIHRDFDLWFQTKVRGQIGLDAYSSDPCIGLKMCRLLQATVAIDPSYGIDFGGAIHDRLYQGLTDHIKLVLRIHRLGLSLCAQTHADGH